METGQLAFVGLSVVDYPLVIETCSSQPTSHAQIAAAAKELVPAEPLV